MPKGTSDVRAGPAPGLVAAHLVARRTGAVYPTNGRPSRRPRRAALTSRYRAGRMRAMSGFCGFIRIRRA